MSEQEWLSQTDVRVLLQLALGRWSCRECHFGWLHRLRGEDEPCPSCARSPRARIFSPRKLRLVGCAFCRAVWDDLTGDPARETVVVAERFADGQASPKELTRAGGRATAAAARDAAGKNPLNAAIGTLEGVLVLRRSLHEAGLSAGLHDQLNQVYANAESAFGHFGRKAVKGIVRLRERHFRDDHSERVKRAVTEDCRRLCGVLYDILGNPFDPVPINSKWLEADGGRVRQVAGGIYADGDFAAMPVLADALQDAGCQDARLLDHCLQDGHYRGCWLLDAILGKR